MDKGKSLAFVNEQSLAKSICFIYFGLKYRVSRKGAVSVSFVDAQFDDTAMVPIPDGDYTHFDGETALKMEKSGALDTPTFFFSFGRNKAVIVVSPVGMDIVTSDHGRGYAAGTIGVRKTLFDYEPCTQRWVSPWSPLIPADLQTRPTRQMRQARP
jgi:hypothetical protein